ncbi:MAG: N-acetyltransferase [Chitinophagaceae bacterium]|nr:N-acetyltransferase [Chitinophagaceae bacterium]
MEEEPDLVIRVAVKSDIKYVYPILQEMERSAKERGTGIARRKPQLLCKKMYEGKAVIALTHEGEWVGFSYIESWSNGAFVSNSGMIVHPRYRGMHVASRIKEMTFELSRGLYPRANIFSITTGAAVLSMNHHLGFRPVTYAEITKDPAFWDQCKACVNHDILESRGRKICLCTAMMYEPARCMNEGKNFQFEKVDTVLL